MKRINQTDALNQEIELLEQKHADQLKALTQQFNVAFESMKPINLIKETFKEVKESPEIKSGIMNSAIGVLFGAISKKVLFGATRNPIKQFIGTAVQLAVSNFVAKHSDKIKSTGESIFNSFSKNRKTKQEIFHSNGDT